MHLHETTVKQNIVYQGRIITVRNDDALLPDGKPCQREVVEHPGGVAIAALTAQQELLFVRQYRYPYQQVLLELPAGKLEAGEDPLLAGKRELLEETGATAAKYDDLGVYYPTSGYCDEVIHLYAATRLQFSAQQLDDDEYLELVRIPLSEAVQMVLDNKIPDGKTQTAVLKLAQRPDIIK